MAVRLAGGKEEPGRVVRSTKGMRRRAGPRQIMWSLLHLARKGYLNVHHVNRLFDSGELHFVARHCLTAGMEIPTERLGKEWQRIGQRADHF